jgi:hypothetical protein
MVTGPVLGPVGPWFEGPLFAGWDRAAIKRVEMKVQYSWMSRLSSRLQSIGRPT